MGAKTIYLVGCDMGGNDYYDGRELSETERATNSKLYGEQVMWLNNISLLARQRGVNIISCTPNSPLNEFLPFKDLGTALKQSEKKVEVKDGPILHSIEAEKLYAENLEKSEKKLYKYLWDSGDYKSQCAAPFAGFIHEQVQKTDRILEIGSGDGTTMFELKKLGHDVTGIDVHSTSPDILECPVWRLPFADGEFDVAISTDVLEHLPTDMVEQSVKELERVAKRQIHVIACFRDRQRVEGEIVHKTVRHISWWKKKFKDSKEIIDRNYFLRGLKHGQQNTVS
jgi:2-polyprenyl-3-methyl-5-hydroxy-6-metoxy-1,4-benzoquinol methylase